MDHSGHKHSHRVGHGVSIPIGKLSLIGPGRAIRPRRSRGRVSIPIGKLSLIGQRICHLRPGRGGGVSIPIGKLSLIGHVLGSDVLQRSL